MRYRASSSQIAHIVLNVYILAKNPFQRRIGRSARTSRGRAVMMKSFFFEIDVTHYIYWKMNIINLSGDRRAMELCESFEAPFGACQSLKYFDCVGRKKARDGSRSLSNGRAHR